MKGLTLSSVRSGSNVTSDAVQQDRVGISSLPDEEQRRTSGGFLLVHECAGIEKEIEG